MRYSPRYLAILCVFALLTAHCYAEEKAFFQKYINQKVFSIDSGAAAVVLYENISSKVDFDYNGSRYTTIYKVSKAIKILKPEALDLANVHLFSYSSEGINVYIKYFKGTTYNADGDNMVATPISESDQFGKKINKENFETSITMPSVKEGSIIEYTYEIEMPMGYKFPSWEIQDDYPKLYSSYQLTHPTQFLFTAISKNIHFEKYNSITDAEKEKAESYYVYTAVTDIAHPFSISYYVRRNVQALRDEPYVSNIDNYREQVEIQAATLGMVLGNKTTWENVNQALWQSKKYGEQIRNKNKFLSHVTDSIANTDTSKLVQAKRIFAYVQANYKRTYYSWAMSDDLDQIYKNRGGGAADINMLFIAMLRQLKFNAWPLILSTTHIPRADSTYALATVFNYTACILKIDGQQYLLDASGKHNMFGILPAYCYNGYARIVDENDGESIMLTSNAVKNKSTYVVSITDITDSSMKYTVVNKLGLHSSLTLRNKWSEDTSYLTNYINKETETFGKNIHVEYKKIENLDNNDTNVIIKYSCVVKNDKPVSMYYLSAVFQKVFGENPFKEVRRKLPIEFQEKMDITSIVNITLPANYELDDMPKSLLLDYQDKQISYSQQMGYSPDMRMISANIHFQLNQTVFFPNNYETMRSFFEKIVQEENNTIIIKKKQ